ncbi:MAG: acyltransferase family protein [Eubacteriales bacterium]|nr:acyltransferase family protein [Eubacteriales bacterium]
MTLEKTSQAQRAFSKEVTLAMKGIAVILMVFHHLFYCSPELMQRFQVSAAPLPQDKLVALSALSKLCVAMFVFLSAYGMTLSCPRDGGREVSVAAFRRYRRLAFGFGIVYLLGLLTSFLREGGISLYFTQGLGKGLLFILLDGMGLASFFSTPTLNETWWYMSVAILLIFVLPLFVRLYDSFGACVLAAAAMYSYFGLPFTAFTMYLFVIFLGIWAARSDLFLLLRQRLGKASSLWFLAGNGGVLLLLCLMRLKWGYEYWLDGVIALLLSLELFVLIELRGIPLRGLAFLGKHSMNIFLTHTLIFEYYFTDFIYSFRNWFLITLALLGSSLLLSIGIEALKKIPGRVRPA